MISYGGSINGGTPKSSMFIRFSPINHPFWGTPIPGNPEMTRFRFSSPYQPKADSSRVSSCSRQCPGSQPGAMERSHPPVVSLFPRRLVKNPCWKQLFKIWDHVYIIYIYIHNVYVGRCENPRVWRLCQKYHFDAAGLWGAIRCHLPLLGISWDGWCIHS